MTTVKIKVNDQGLQNNPVIRAQRNSDFCIEYSVMTVDVIFFSVL